MKSTINFGYLIFLSVVAALGGFLFGYDTAVISGTIAQVTQLFQLDALQQGWYVWGIERSGFFNDRGKWVKGFENQRV